MTVAEGVGRRVDGCGPDRAGLVAAEVMASSDRGEAEVSVLDAERLAQEGDRAGGLAAIVTTSAVPVTGKSREDVPAPPAARGAIGDWEDDAAWEARGARGQPPAVPVLHLDGFDGPMDLLLDLAERQRIDLGRLSIVVLVEQFLAAVEALRHRVALERRADWLVMATRLVLLRSRLLCPESPEAAQAAERDAAAELRRLDNLVAMRAAAHWLGARPILGEVVFARGAPEPLGLQLGTEHTVDVIDFLWSCLALFDDDAAGPDTQVQYRPVWRQLHSVTEARDRILRILEESGEGSDGEALILEHFLPEAATATDEDGTPLQGPLLRASAWATTLSAGLELAKQGDVALAQADAFASVHVRRPIEPGP